MPFIDVKIFEERLAPETERALISALTDAVAGVLGEKTRPFTWVVLDGTPAQRWGIGGEPGEAK
ncbi:tautomerase family protein [Saccharopolyspora sp. NPDC000995]